MDPRLRGDDGHILSRNAELAAAASRHHAPPPQIQIPATYLRGGTSKGVFFLREELPEAARVPGAARDAILLRVIGSPDPYGKHTDGMGGATSSTSKTVIISRSEQPDHDVDYLFGQVAIDKPCLLYTSPSPRDA